MNDCTPVTPTSEQTVAGPVPGRLGPSFAALGWATGLANLGDGLSQFMLPILAVSLTRSPVVVAGVTVMVTLAWPLFGLQAGSIVDRVDRRRLMLVSNLVRVAVLGLLTAAIAGDVATIPAVYVVALVLGVTETLVDTGLTAVVPAVVGRDDLARANGRIEAVQNVANQFIGPPLAGALAARSLAMAGGAAAAVYAGALGAVTLLRGSFTPVCSEQRPEDGTDERGFWSRLTRGLVFVWRDPLLRVLTVTTAAMNVLWAAWTAVIVLYALAPGPVGLTRSQYGLLMTAMAAGGLLGALAVEPLRRRLGARTVLAIDLVGTALLVGVPGLTTEPVVIGVATLVGGAGSAVWRVIVATLRQLVVPDHLLGRVYSAGRFVSWGVLPLGALLGGLAAELAGVRTVFLSGGALGIVLLACFLVIVAPDDLRRAEESSHCSGAGDRDGDAGTGPVTSPSRSATGSSG